MGLFDWMRGQFIDIIEWLDDSNDTLVWRFPRHNNEIKNGAQLVVREGQVAVFVDQGKLADTFEPGTYSLTTENLPVLSTFRGWKHGFESPYKAEVYFINTKQYLDMKWGTMNPITMRDADFGIVRVRAFGVYAIRVDAANVATFLTEVVGTDGLFTTDEIEGQLRRMLVSAFTTTLGKSGIPVLDLAGNYDEIARQCKTTMESQFAEYGLHLSKFLIENISLPAEVEKSIDQRASMGAIGNMATYTQFQAASSIRDAAQNPGGMAGMGMGAGAGFGFGAMMSNAMGVAQAAVGQQAAPSVAAEPPGSSLADRLKQLKALHEGGLIDDATFAAKRDAILSEI
ncbi:MAG: SPFH domain-containing protein [Myxococcota bacterium]|nr:SPFH domain-containing protein [Myxococcota bacterium]